MTARVENGIRIDSRVNIPAIASLDSPQVPRAQVMVSTIRKAKEGVKRHGRGYIARCIAINPYRA